jgi:hypothetical protein
MPQPGYSMMNSMIANSAMNVQNIMNQQKMMAAQQQQQQ